MAKNKSAQNLCPCGSGLAFEACCGRYFKGDAWPETAEKLMRSRFTAFFLGDESWLRRTWAEENCPKEEITDKNIKWLGLTIKSTSQIDETHATVTFVARGRYLNRGAFRMGETSTFEKRDGKWIYVDGVASEEQK